MQQFRLFKLLLRPSLFSAISSILLSLIALGIGNWLYVARNSFISDYLFGAYGLVTALQKSQGNLLPVIIGIFDKPFSYNIIVLLVAIVCGVLVYVALESVTHSVDTIQETWEKIHYASGASRKLVEVELGTRWIIRSAAITSWIAYWIIWLSVIMPFCLIASRRLLSDTSSLDGWLYGALGLFVCLLGFHMHIIFIRLVLLRPRVFGHNPAVELESYNQH